MNRNYIFLTLLMLLLAFGTIFIARNKEPKQIDPLLLLTELVQPTRFVSTDQVARMMIANDPSLMLMDVRNNAAYRAFSLPGAINLPIDSLMGENFITMLGVPGTKVVFFSNDDIEANKMWQLTKRLGYTNIYVMKGGLNHWMETIIKPVKPSDDEPYTAFETYMFRKGAQQFFTGTKTDNSTSSKVEIKVRRRAKTSVVAGGC